MIEVLRVIEVILIRVKNNKIFDNNSIKDTKIFDNNAIINSLFQMID